MFFRRRRKVIFSLSMFTTVTISINTTTVWYICACMSAFYDRRFDLIDSRSAVGWMNCVCFKRLCCCCASIITVWWSILMAWYCCLPTYLLRIIDSSTMKFHPIDLVKWYHLMRSFVCSCYGKGAGCVWDGPWLQPPPQSNPYVVSIH